MLDKVEIPHMEIGNFGGCPAIERYCESLLCYVQQRDHSVVNNGMQ